MNVTARDAVMACPDCGRAAKFVFLHMQDLADDGLFQPTVLDVAARAHGDRTSTLRALHQLAKCGHIASLRRDPGPRSCNVYFITMPAEDA